MRHLGRRDDRHDTGEGKGGRNQEFVLAAAIDIAGLKNVCILSAGTDGTDGPTDAAGAICDGRHAAPRSRCARIPRSERLVSLLRIVSAI